MNNKRTPNGKPTQARLLSRRERRPFCPELVVLDNNPLKRGSNQMPVVQQLVRRSPLAAQEGSTRCPLLPTLGQPRPVVTVHRKVNRCPSKMACLPPLVDMPMNIIQATTTVRSRKLPTLPRTLTQLSTDRPVTPAEDLTSF